MYNLATFLGPSPAGETVLKSTLSVYNQMKSKINKIFRLWMQDQSVVEIFLEQGEISRRFRHHSRVVDLLSRLSQLGLESVSEVNMDIQEVRRFHPNPRLTPSDGATHPSTERETVRPGLFCHPWRRQREPTRHRQEKQSEAHFGSGHQEGPRCFQEIPHLTLAVG